MKARKAAATAKILAKSKSSDLTTPYGSGKKAKPKIALKVCPVVRFVLAEQEFLLVRCGLMI